MCHSFFMEVRNTVVQRCYTSAEVCVIGLLHLYWYWSSFQQLEPGHFGNPIPSLITVFSVWNCVFLFSFKVVLYVPLTYLFTFFTFFIFFVYTVWNTWSENGKRTLTSTPHQRYCCPTVSLPQLFWLTVEQWELTGGSLTCLYISSRYEFPAQLYNWWYLCFQEADGQIFHASVQR